MKLSNYLTFNGNCREAFDFYKKVFNAELVDINTFDQMPSDDNMPPLDENDKNRILHICIKIGEDSFLMGSDTLGCMKHHKEESSRCLWRIPFGELILEC